MQIKKFMVGPLMANCYIVWDDKTPGDHQGFIVDPGGWTPQLEKHIADNHIVISKILLTHGHYDHISGLKQAKAYTGAKVYIHHDDAACLISPGRNISTMMGGAATFEPADVLLSDGDTVEPIDGFTLQVIHTPGHTPGGCCYYGGNVVFTGDTLFCGSVGRTDFPGGSYTDIIASVKRLYSLMGDDVVVLPGHGENSTIGYERKNNPFVHE